MKKPFPAAGLALLVGVLSAGQVQSPGLDPRKQERDSRTILIDVIAEKDGLPVTDLSKDDFEVLADGKSIALESLARITPVAPDSSAGIFRKRLAVVFHDLNYSASGIRPEDEKEIVRELVALADRGIDLMVLQLDRFRGLSVLQSFTREEKLIRAAAVKAMDKTGVDSFADYSFADLKRWVFKKTVGGLIAVCAVLKSRPGRKSLLFVSSGIPDLASFDQADMADIGKAGLGGLSRRLQEHEDRLELADPFNVFRGEKMRSGDEVLRKTIEFISAQTVAVYSLDPGVFASAASPSSAEYLFDTEKKNVEAQARTQAEDKSKGIQNLRFLAEETSGLYFRGADKFAELRQKLGADLDSYYALRIILDKKGAEGGFHKLTVKVGRRGLDIRARNGYRVFSAAEEKNMTLSGAYHGPELFKEVPFEAEFIPYLGESGRIEPWIAVALPVHEIFESGALGTGPRTFTLHVSLEEPGGDAPGFRGKYGIPIKVTTDFIASLPKMRFLWMYFKGPDIVPLGKKYRAIYVLYDEEKAAAGAWTTLFTFPDISDGQKAALVNCVLGSPGRDPARGEAIFSLNPKTGLLEYGPLMFYPRVTGQFSAAQDAFVFLQIFSPRGRDALAPEFQIWGPGPERRTVPGETPAESWNEKTKVWNGLIKLSLKDVAPGDIVLRVAIPGPASSGRFVRTIPLAKLAHTP